MNQHKLNRFDDVINTSSKKQKACVRANHPGAELKTRAVDGDSTKRGEGERKVGGGRILCTEKEIKRLHSISVYFSILVSTILQCSRNLNMITVHSSTLNVIRNNDIP